MNYYIACMRHTAKDDYVVTFWGHNKLGYTPNLDEAGLYSEEDAKSISSSVHGEDFPIGEDYAKSISVEREYNYTHWKKGSFILNDELFWNTFNINKRKLFKRGSDQKQYFRYCKE